MTRRFWFSPDRHRLIEQQEQRVLVPVVGVADHPVPLTTSVSLSHRINNNTLSKTDIDDSCSEAEECMTDDSVDNDIQGFDDMIRRLRKNELTQLRLGWTDSNYFSPNNHHHHHHFTGRGGTCTGQYQQQLLSNHRRIKQATTTTGINNGNLIRFGRALRMNKSVRSISLGWRLSPNILNRIVTALNGLPLHQLLHIKIVVLGSSTHNNELCENLTIPDTILTDLFNRQQKVVSIDLRSVQVSKVRSEHYHPQQQQPRSTPDAWRKSKPKSNNNKIHHHHYQQPSQPGSVITQCIVQQYDKLARLKSLSLIDCGITGDIAIELAQFIHIRGGIDELSLRNNRTLASIYSTTSTSKSGHNKCCGIRMICQAPIMRKLDLSLCDFDGTDIIHVANGIASRTYPIGEIMLAGNYRMDYIGLNALVQPKCCQKMVVLNVSYCSISSDRLVKLLNTLEQMKSHDTLLRRVVLCGAAIANDTAIVALENLLRSECPIRSLQLHNAQEPKSISLRHLRLIADAMSFNYDMEELIIDHGFNDEATPIWVDLNFYLQLNFVGRRIVRPVQHRPVPFIVSSQSMLHRYLHRPVRNLIMDGTSSNDWFCVLERAGKVDNLDVLNWIVRHSVDHFQYKILGADHTYVQHA